MMLGPRALVESISVPEVRGQKDPRPWQYHSRSDHHSKVACWLVAADLLATSSVLARHVREEKVVLGVNHEMRDFEQDRKKDLDLVIARPRDARSPEARTLADLAVQYRVRLTREGEDRFQSLPPLYVGPVGAVLVALEAKAAMTAHVKALPRLHDELNSSHLTVHGASASALAAGLVMVNAATTFISPDRNPDPNAPLVVSQHRQPRDAERVVEKIKQLRRRADRTGRGFDSIGIVVVDCANDGSPVTLVEEPPAPARSDQYHYEQMIRRLASEYDTTFAGI